MSNQVEIAKRIDALVGTYVSDKITSGLERAINVSSAIGELRSLITADMMKPIMALQGSSMGFKTDKDKDKDNGGGYPESIVKDCLIQAILTGVQPTGNHFNIIAGNMYLTKEGFTYLLKRFPGLKYDINCTIPKFNEDKTQATIDVKITWAINNKESESTTISLAINSNKWLTSDAIVGKANRKAKCWLFNTLAGNGIELADADADEVAIEHKAHVILSSEKTTEKAMSIAQEKIAAASEEAKIVMDFDGLTDNLPRNRNESSLLHKKLSAIGVDEKTVLFSIENKEISFKDYKDFCENISRDALEIYLKPFEK